MPIYEYECTLCGHHLEALQNASEAALKKCPKCKRPFLEKLVSATSFQLKGTGWYVTDFRNKGKTKEKKQETDSSAGRDKKTATKSSETKKDKATD